MLLLYLIEIQLKVVVVIRHDVSNFDHRHVYHCSQHFHKKCIFSKNMTICVYFSFILSIRYVFLQQTNDATTENKGASPFLALGIIFRAKNVKNYLFFNYHPLTYSCSNRIGLGPGMAKVSPAHHRRTFVAKLEFQIRVGPHCP